MTEAMTHPIEKPSIKKDNIAKYGKKFPDGANNNIGETTDSANQGYQGSGKRSADPVFEKKRSEYTKSMKNADVEIAKCRQRLDKIEEEVYFIQTGGKEKNSVKGEIRGKLNDARNKLKQVESEKYQLFAKLKEVQESQKKKVDELNNAKEKLPFKRIDDIDKKIIEMEKQLESGSMKLIDEKRIVAEMSKMRKNRKGLEALSSQQNVVDEFKKQVDILKASVSEKEKDINAQRDVIKKFSTELISVDGGNIELTQVKLKGLAGERETLKKKLSSHYEEKSKAYEEYQAAQESHKQWFEEELFRREENYKRKEIELVISELEVSLKNLELPACSKQIED